MKEPLMNEDGGRRLWAEDEPGAPLTFSSLDFIISAGRVFVALVRGPEIISL